MSKNILMICYYYPPLTDVGCKRSVAFSTYWKKAGWKPHVLSVRNPDKTYCSLGDDKPPEGVEVTYTYSLFNVYKFFGKLNGLLCRILGLFGIKLENNYFYPLFCIPDIFIGWVPLAIINGLKIIKNNNIDLIYVSCSPFSSGIIGLWLKKITGKPIVVDYRDAFGLDISEYQKKLAPVWFRKPLDRWITSRILKSCDLFTTTTEEMSQLYSEQFPFVKDKIHTIYNGFDHYLLDELEEQEKYSKFTIIYTGNFYYNVEYDYFFGGLGLLKKDGKICSDKFQFLFYGGDMDRIQDLLYCHDIADLVIIRDRISYKEILVEIKKSHLQLLRIIQPMISTKLFEGIALNIPFLATIPQGEVKNIVRVFSPGSFLVTDGNSNTVARRIEEAIKAYEEHKIKPNSVGPFLHLYSREKTSINMLRLLNLLDFRVTAPPSHRQGG